MDPNQSNLTVADSVKEVLKTLPPILRAYVSQQRYVPVVKSLVRTYNLRVDQGGVLEREVVFLLMGIENPDEFIDALVVEGNIARQTVNNIVRDVNAQIFVPLRAEERGNIVQMFSPPAAPSGPQSHFHLQNKIAPPPRPAGVPPPVASPSRPALREALASAVDSSKLLEDHEEPHIELEKKPAPPPNLPGQMPPVPPPPLPKPNVLSGPVVPRIIPPGQRAAPVSGAAIGIPPAPKVAPPPPKPEIPTSYSVDPYREPIDEQEK